MKNLAGNREADQEIKEELYLADIETHSLGHREPTEVPYTIVGRIGEWVFRRAWRYWMATVENPVDGLPLESALELHNKLNPTNPDQHLGQVIRSGGHAGAPSPDEYGAHPMYEKELESKLVELGYELKEVKIGDEIHEYVDINVGEINKLYNEGKLDVKRSVTCYHIDSQVGLHEFAEFIKKYYISKK
jgi:hypothetical protein